MDCAGDPGCAQDPVSPAPACMSCVQAQADMGAASPCVASAALGTECQSNADCAAMVNCVLGGGTQQQCATQFPAGYQVLFGEVYRTCADCG
jgi:hypothetical protein